MASMKEIWAEAKEGVKKENVKFADGMRKNAERTKVESRKISESSREEMRNIQAEREIDKTKPFNSKKAWTAFGFVLSLPLFLFGLFLLFVAGVIIWSIF